MKAYLNSSLDWLSKTQSETYFHPITVEQRDWQELMSLPHWDMWKIKSKVYEIINDYNSREEDEWFNF